MPKALESPVAQISFGNASIDTVMTDDRSGLKVGAVIVIPVPTADTQQTYALPSEVRAFTAKMTLGKLSIKFQASGDYATRSPGSAYVSGKISPDAGTTTLYFESTKDADSLEIETWI